jgi:anti-anti-sigma factor
MQIEKNSQGDLLELSVVGRLDNDSSVYFREEIESSAREGWHRILVDLSGVTYLSSSGIAALVDSKKRLDRLDGFFGIHNATSAVLQILSLTRLLDKLECDAQKVRESAPKSLATGDAVATRVEENGLELEIYSLKNAPPLVCRIIGDPRCLLDSNAAEPQPQTVSFGSKTFGLGLGALGDHWDASKSRCGEFLAVAGGVAQSAHKSRGLPDYLLAAGDFVPEAQVLYGMTCEGELPTLIRFCPLEAETQAGLSKIVASCLKQAKARLAGFIILADCAGLVGAQIRQSPAKIPKVGQNGADRFALPGVRQWLSFSAEQIHRHNLVLIVGIAGASEGIQKSSPLFPLLRPMGPDRLMASEGELVGHFHAAVFPYRPLKKRVLPLESSVTDLFDSGSIEDVLHLLQDDRPITGLGESELFGGACWLGPIGEVLTAERDVVAAQGNIAVGKSA